MREIFAQPAFAPYRGSELNPGPDCQTDAQLDEYVRRTCDTDYHASCTCPMGREGESLAVTSPTTGQVCCCS